ncbi:MAG: HAMP domain-containing sensor histidine kinase [Candidatus Saccharimonadales bacterium]|jgi:signal transduction histidine kinase
MDIQLVLAIVFFIFSASLVYLAWMATKSFRTYFPVFVMSSGAAIWVISNYFANMPSKYALFWNRLSFLSASLLIGGVLMVSEHINTYNNKKNFNVVSKFIIIAICVAGACIIMLSTMLVSRVELYIGPNGIENGVAPVRGILYPLYLLLILIGLVGVILKLTRGYINARRSKDDSEVKKYKYLILGIVLSILSGIITNVILSVYVDQFYANFSQISVGILISTLVYSILRHQLFDIKSSVFRALGYVSTLLVVALASTGIILRIVLPLVGQGSDYDPQVYAVTFLAVIFVSWVTPKFRKFFDRITYKIFYRNSYDPLLFAGQISAVVTSNPKTTDLQKGLLKLYHKAFGSQYIQIIVNHAEDEAFNQKQLEIGQTLGVGAPSEVLKFYERLFIGHEHKNKFVLRSKIDFEEGSEEAKLLDQHSIGMIAKLKLNRRIVGYLVFGDKTSGTLYTLEDIALITGHYSEVAIALQNSTRYNRIAAFNLELQEKIEIATFKLKKSNARLRKLDKAKDDFLSIASHQLRTPLTVVRGNIDLVANGDLGPITEDAKGVLIQSERSAGRLSDLINDFLSTSRLKTGKFILTPAPVNLKFTVEQQIEQLIDFAAQRGIELTLHKVDDNLPVINADEEKLRQVMLNTIDNAIYYSSRHSGKVDVALYNDGKNIVYKVKDNGIGVPANEKSKMFTRMYRADNAKNARPDGNGLGLFLMKKIIDAHHGEIIFESEEGKGSTFGFKLALNPKVELTKQAIT